MIFEVFAEYCFTTRLKSFSFESKVNLHLNEKRKGFWSQFWSCELALATEFHIEDVTTCKERGRKKLVEKARFGETSYEKGLLDSSGDPQDFFAIEVVLTLTL